MNTYSLLPFVYLLLTIACVREATHQSKIKEKTQTVVSTTKKGEKTFNYREIKNNYLFSDSKGCIYLCDSCYIMTRNYDDKMRFCCFHDVLFKDSVKELKIVIDTNTFHKVSQYQYQDKRHLYKLDLHPARFPSIIVIK